MDRSFLPQESVTNVESATSCNLDDPAQVHALSWPDTQLISALNLKRRDLGSSSTTPSEGSTLIVEEKMDASSPSNLSLYQKFKESKQTFFFLLSSLGG